MPTRELLAPSQRAQFTELPSFDERTLGRFYTLSDDDLRLIRRHRRPSTQLGFAGTAQAGLVPASERIGLGAARTRPHRPRAVHARMATEPGAPPPCDDRL